MDQKEIVDLLEKNYKLISMSNAKWLDKRVKYLLARIFTGSGQLLQVEDFDWLDTALLHKSGIFSSLTRITRHTMTGLMLANQKNSVEGIEELFFNKKILKDNGFKSSSSTYFAAYQLFLSDSHRREDIAKRAQGIYQGIKSSHPIITTTTDYSSMISLAQSAQLDELTELEICQLVDYYFECLQELGLKNKNSCLVSATLITLMTGKIEQEFLTKLSEVMLYLEGNNLKVKTVHFVPLISLTYLLKETEESNLDELLLFIQQITKQISLLFESDYKEALAISLYVENKSKRLTTGNLSALSVSLNQIIVQEHAMLATNAVVLLS
ncbi:MULTISPECIES: DUF4003 family protein [Vagococcus]|uniref:DUF4003 family protein n=1 Tax=Vagococcus TaxID=2737 RepID=UPI002FC5BF1D